MINVAKTEMVCKKRAVDLSETKGATRTYTVGCSFDKLVPDEGHKALIREAVQRAHKATILATELLNLHVRRCFEEFGGEGLSDVFSANWIYNVYNEVTVGNGAPKVVAELRETRDRFMPAFEPVQRTGMLQILRYDCRNLAAVAANNIWMHFQRRLLSHVCGAHALDDAAYKALAKPEKTRRRLALMQVAEDVTRPPTQALRSPVEYHPWIASERVRLKIDESVGAWGDKPFLYHLKCHPQRFLHATRIMSVDREVAEKRPFALFALRRTLVPRHIRFDQEALRELLKLGGSEHRKEQAKQAAKRRKTDAGRVDLEVPPLERKSQRRSKEQLVDEKAIAFAAVLDLRAAGTRQAHRFDFAFTTDGVCARLQYTKATGQKNANSALAPQVPSRGLYAIDELKRVSRLEQLHVVGVDPGIREMVVAVDQDDPKGTSPVRYTQRQRLRDLRSRQYADEGARSKPAGVALAEEELSAFSSRSPSLATFCAFCGKRRERLEECLQFYATIAHRRRRWKTCIKAQQSEERLYGRLKAIHKKDDKRQLVLAYGSWGASDTASCVKRGNPPTIGVGLMRKLAKRFVVALTPEHHTSSICCK